MSSKIYSTVAFISILLLGLYIYQGDKKETEIKKISMAVYEGDTSSLIFLAKKNGYFKENGLDVELKLYPSGKLALDAFLRGEVDYANCAEYVAVKNSFKRDDYKIIASVAEANINGMLAKRSKNINSEKDIKGKKVGASLGTAAEHYVGVFLSQNGLAFESVDLIDINPLKIEESLIDDKVDVVFSWEPIIYNMIHKYPDQLVFFPMPVGFPFYFSLVSNNSNSNETSIKVLDSLLKSQKWINSNKIEFKEFLKKRFNLSESYAQYTMNKHLFELSLPYSMVTMIDNQAKWLVKNKLVENTDSTNYLKIIDTKALKEVLPHSITIIE